MAEHEETRREIAKSFEVVKRLEKAMLDIHAKLTVGPVSHGS